MNIKQNQPQDPTEDWLRQTLGGHRPEAPADAWQRLVPHLPKHKRRSPFALWLSGAAVGVAVALALFWFLKNAETPTKLPISVEKTPQVAQVLSDCFPVFSAKNSLKNWAAKNTGAFPQPNFKKSASEKPRGFSPCKISKNPPVEAFARTDKPVATSNFGPISFKKEASEVFGFQEKTITIAPALLEKAAPSQVENPLEKLPGKTSTPLVLAERSLPEFQFSATPILLKKVKKPIFWLGIEASPALFMQKNMGEMPVGLAFSEMHPRPGRGWQAGVSLAVEPLKNWRFGFSIQHLRQTHEAAHLATLRLMDGVCLNPHDVGLKEYEFRYAVVSGSEQSDLTLRLQQQGVGSTMPDDEPFTLEMKTVHRSAALRVPLTVERRFEAGGWRGFVRGGAVVDFSEKAKTEITHFIKVCQDLCFQSGYVPIIQSSSASKTSVGWLVGAGIERQISRRAALRFEPFMVGQKGSMQCGLNLGLLFSN